MINPYIGRWHITEMDMWDEEFFNMDGQAYIQIDEDGGGRFEFGAVQAELDGKVSEDQRFEFSFQEFDEGDSPSESILPRCSIEPDIRTLFEFRLIAFE